MQITTHQAGLDSSIARLALALALAQRIALAALAMFLMLNAVTPFITPDPRWLANLPLVVAIMAFLLAFGLSHIREERARAAATIRLQLVRSLFGPLAGDGILGSRPISSRKAKTKLGAGLTADRASILR